MSKRGIDFVDLFMIKYEAVIEAIKEYKYNPNDYRAFKKCSDLEQIQLKMYNRLVEKIGFADNYEAASYKEREIFEDFLTKENPFPEHYYIYISPYYTSNRFDVMLYSVKDNMIDRRLFIEIKVRDKVWPDYILEKKKYDDLIKIASKYKNSSVFYMNFTPDGTYIWNTKIVKNLNTTTSLMNKSTMNSDYKIDKDVWYLDPKYAKKYDYKYK